MINTNDSKRSDNDLRKEPPTPSQSGSGGGTLATDIGTEDEEKAATGGDPQPTRVSKKDKVQPPPPTRAGDGGAAR